MKKILSLGAAAAVLSMTAVAASAAVQADIIGDVNPGATVTVQITSTGVASETMMFSLDVDGMTYVAGSAVEGSAGLISVNESLLQVAGMAMGGFKDDVVATFDFVVDADAENVSVALVALDEATAADIDTDAFQVEITVPGTDEPDPETPADPEGPSIDDPETPADPEGPSIDDPETPVDPETPADPENPSDEDTTNPPMGVALAVVPAVLAGAAVVVAKKRK